MKKVKSRKFQDLIVLVITLLFAVPAFAENPRNHIDFWKKTYGELSSKDDPRVEKAQKIFQRVLNAAGKRPGVVPRLIIIKDDSLLASAIPDGSIILAKGVLDICYKDPARGDDRLAFILGHEIAHQLKDDFWHMKFFQAIELSGEKNLKNNIALKEVKDIAKSTDKMLAKELQADEHGIIYATMAGFNTRAIITEEDRVNFFEEWVKTLDRTRIPGVHKDPTHPGPEHRAEAVKARLRQVLDKTEFFNLGLLFYQTGDYKRAVLFFSDFLRFFPGREVYHNLAASYHQIALKYYRKWKKKEQKMPFKLSISIDPETRAKKISLRGRDASAGSEELFKKNIGKSIEYYNSAISQDPSYKLSYNNLASAYIIKGEFYKAIGTLQDALKIDPRFSEALNNLGVAFFYIDSPGKAMENLDRAREIDPSYNAPLFNLGKIAYEEKKVTEAKEYWTAYMKLDSTSPWANSIRQVFSLSNVKKPLKSSGIEGVENIDDLEAGTYIDEIPKSWGGPKKTRDISIQANPFRMAVYNNNVMTLSQEDSDLEEPILLVSTLEGYKGKSLKGIILGSREKEVLSKYGAPSKVLNTTRGKSWVYENPGIAFQVREGKVLSWLLF